MEGGICIKEKWRNIDPVTKKSIAGITVCLLIILFVIIGSLGHESSPVAKPPLLTDKRFLYKLPITYQDNTQGCWESGDSQYDCDAQAKLIALSNVYYAYQDNPDILEKIAYKAIEIRNTAGSRENDGLLEADQISDLGKALDKASVEGTLSYPVLQALQNSFVSISQNESPYTLVSLFTFGNVDIKVTIVKSTVLNGETAKYDDEVLLSVAAHYPAYVIYLREFEYSMIDTRSALIASGYSSSDICTVEAFSEEKFAETWNAIGPESTGLKVPFVFILAHAQPDELFGNQFRFSTYEISQLKEIPVETLFLYGCSAGHFGYMDTNPAAVFSQKISGGHLLASDSTVHYEPNEEGVLKYTPIEDDTFAYYIETDGRESMGWLIYQYHGGEISVYEVGAVSLTANDMLEIMKTADITEKYPKVN